MKKKTKDCTTTLPNNAGENICPKCGKPYFYVGDAPTGGVPTDWLCQCNTWTCSNNPTGWICPSCGRSINPNQITCPFCNQGVTTTYEGTTRGINE